MSQLSHLQANMLIVTGISSMWSVDVTAIKGSKLIENFSMLSGVPPSPDMFNYKPCLCLV